MNLYQSLENDGFYVAITEGDKIALQLYTERVVMDVDEARSVARWIEDSLLSIAEAKE